MSRTRKDKEKNKKYTEKHRKAIYANAKRHKELQ
jgi:hypothetical protein